MALIDYGRKKIYLNVKDGKIERPFKNSEGAWERTTHSAIEGYVVDVEVQEKEDYTKRKYKELQLHILDDEYYVLCCRAFKPFSDGLLASLANTDLSKPHRISPYKGNAREAGITPPTYCSVKMKGNDESVRWIDGIPEIQYEDGGDGTTTPLRGERNKFFLNIIEEIHSNTKENREKLLKPQSAPLTETPVEEEDDYSEGSLE